MEAMLILNDRNVQDFCIIVSMSNKKLSQKVIELLEKDRDRDAFELLKSKAEVRAYLPRGQRPPVRPKVALVEDFLYQPLRRKPRVKISS